MTLRRTVRELAACVGGRVVGDPDVEIRGFAGIDRAKHGDITFVGDDRYLPELCRTQASAVVLKAEVADCAAAQIITPEPNLAFARIVGEAQRARARGRGGIDARAFVDPTASVDPTATIRGGAVIEERAKVGPRTIIGAGAYVGEEAVIGADCMIHPNVSILHGVTIGDRVIIHAGAVLGSDGFGYATDEKGVHHKIPQVGCVIVEDDVEIGANTCVDRARFHETRIGRGSKLDNLVQVGHNVVIGNDSALAAHVGIAGSSVLGHHVVLGGMVGVRDHVKIGDRTRVGAYSGVANDLEAGHDYLGIPAMPYRQGLKIRLLTTKLPEIDAHLKAALDRIAMLEAEVKRLGEVKRP
jgi:UDP-3-O-[3-hydroxymyristoyl] glucosamine N-acyltransferase